MIGGVWLTGEFDRLETVLSVRLDRVDGVENPDEDGVGTVRLGRTDGIGNTDGRDGVAVDCRRLAAQFVLSMSPVAAFCCLFLWLVVMSCTCFSVVVGFLLVASFAV